VKKILHKQEIEDIIVGATLLGAGGGGSPKTGLLLLKDISEVTLFDLEEIPDDSHIAVVAGMGSPVVLSRIGWKGEEITALENVLYASDTFKGERLARAVTAELGMQVGIACYTMTGKQLKTSAIPSALSIAENVGRTIRKAKENREDIAASVTRAVNGTLLAMGTVSKKIEEVKAGFDYGKVFVEDLSAGFE